MSVDTQVFIGVLTNQVEHKGRLKGKAWFQVVAIIEMRGYHYSAFNELRRQLAGNTFPEVFVYELDGEKEIFKDKYNAVMRVVPFDVFYDVVKRDYEESKEDDGRPYRRLAWLRSLLAAMNANEKPDNLAVAIYEH